MTTTPEAAEAIRILLRAHGAHRRGDGWGFEEQGCVCRLQIRSVARGRHSGTPRLFLEISTQLTSCRQGVWDDRSLALLNARAVGGCYGVVRNRLCLRAQLPLDDQVRHGGHMSWLISALVQSQLQLGYVTPQNFAHLQSPTSPMQRFSARWVDPVPAVAWSELKEKLLEDGIYTDLADSGAAFELPLGDQRFIRARHPRRQGALIRITTGVPHPLAGAGYLATIRLPTHSADSTAVAKLNRMEQRTARLAPRLGAWGLRDGGSAIVYSQFLPTARARSGLEQLIASWMIARVRWLRRSVWQVGAGFCL